MSSLMLVNPRKPTAKRKAPARRKKRGGLFGIFNRPKARTRTKTKTRASSSRASAAAPRRRRSSSRRSNMSLKGLMNNAFVPAAIGGAGALGVNIAWGMLPVPANLKTGPMAPFIKLGATVGIAMLAGKVVGKKAGDQILVGAVTVGMFDLAKSFVQRAAPNLSLGDADEFAQIGYVNPGSFMPDPSLSEYVSGADMSEYISGNVDDYHYSN